MAGEDAWKDGEGTTVLDDARWLGHIFGSVELDKKRVKRSSTQHREGLRVGGILACHAREVLKRRLHYTCSAGVANNKLLAKMAGEVNKPDAQTILFPEAANRLLSLRGLKRVSWPPHTPSFPRPSTLQPSTPFCFLIPSELMRLKHRLLVSVLQSGVNWRQGTWHLWSRPSPCPWRSSTPSWVRRMPRQLAA